MNKTYEQKNKFILKNEINIKVKKTMVLSNILQSSKENLFTY